LARAEAVEGQRGGSDRQQDVGAKPVLLKGPESDPESRILPLAEVKPGMKDMDLRSSPERRSSDSTSRSSASYRHLSDERESCQGCRARLEESGSSRNEREPRVPRRASRGPVSAGWAFAKRPIGIVTPIESMLKIDPDVTGKERVKSPLGAAPLPASFDFGGRAETFLAAITGDDDDRLERLRKVFAGFLLRHATWPRDALAPLARFDGFRSSAGPLASELARFGFVDTGFSAMGGSASGTGLARESAEPLHDGSSITALLVDGDLQLGVTGTVTHVLKDGRFVAFGHPFLGLGEWICPSRTRISWSCFRINISPSRSAIRSVRVPAHEGSRYGWRARTDRVGADGSGALPVRERRGLVTTLELVGRSAPKALPS